MGATKRLAEMILQAMPWSELQSMIDELLARVEDDDYAAVRKLLRDTVQGYVPEKEIVDLVYTQKSTS